MIAYPHRIHLSKPHLAKAELGYVRQAFESNWLSTVGSNLGALETTIQRLVGQSAVALVNGTAGSHLAEV